MTIVSLLPLSYFDDFFSMFDKKLKDIDLEIQKSNDPETDGLCDRGEFIAGLGFVLIQKWLESNYSLHRIKKSDALKLGPIACKGMTFATLANAAADFWKHEEEIRKGDAPSRSLEIILQVTENMDYPLNDILIALSGSTLGLFTPLLPKMAAWEQSFNDELYKKAT